METAIAVDAMNNVVDAKDSALGAKDNTVGAKGAHYSEKVDI